MSGTLKKLLIGLGVFIGLIALVAVFSGDKPVQNASFVTEINGENLTSYVVNINGVPTQGEGSGLEKKFMLAAGTYSVSIEANGFSTLVKEVVIKPGENRLKATLIEFDGPQRAFREAFGLTAAESKDRQGGVDVISADKTTYTIKNAAYFKDNTWLVANVATGGQNTDGEVVVLQLVNGVWVVVAAGTGLSPSELAEAGVPPEVASYVGVIVGDIASEGGATTAGGSNGSGSSVGSTSNGSGSATGTKALSGSATCKSGVDRTACEKYLRDIGAYFAGNGGTNIQRCGATVAGGTGSGNYLTIFFPSGVNETDLATRIEAYIRQKKPSSPWLTIPNIGTRLVAEGKKYNVNPVLIVLLGVSESGLGTSALARRQNNYFGQKATASAYRTFASPTDSLFGPNSILVGMPNRLANHPNYKNVKNLYEYLSVHVSGQIIYPGDNVRIYDPVMKVYVTSELDAQYGPIPYWKIAVQVVNGVTGQNYPSTPPSRGGETATQSAGAGGSSASCSQTAGAGGWDLPGEGPNPMTYYSQLYKCNETPPADRSFAKTCDKAVGENAFGSAVYGSGTMERCGCGPTSLAMAVTTLTGRKTLPTDVARYAEQNGGVDSSGCGSSWFWAQQATQDYYGINVTPINSSEIASSLKAGRMIIVSLSQFPTTGSDVGHISVIRKVDAAGNIFFADTYAGAWGTEKKPETASRMAFTEAQLAGMTKGLWAVSKK